ncbi:hypothetical protein V8E53_012559 [Lactarius tabidus]
MNLPESHRPKFFFLLFSQLALSAEIISEPSSYHLVRGFPYTYPSLCARTCVTYCLSGPYIHHVATTYLERYPRRYRQKRRGK